MENLHVYKQYMKRILFTVFNISDTGWNLPRLAC